MLSIIVVVVAFSILIVVHELGHFLMAKRCGVRVDRFSLGFGPKIIGIKRNGTEYRLSAVPFGGYVKMAGETYEDSPSGAEWEFLSKKPGERFGIVIFGPLLNYILGFILFSIVFMMGAPTLTNKIGKVLDEYPAKHAGVEPGDRIVSIDGQKVEYWHELTAIMHDKLEGKVEIAILRDDKTFPLIIKPKIREFKDVFGNTVKAAMIGITPSEDLMYIKYNLFESLYKGLLKVLELTILTFRGIWSLIIGRLSLKDAATGPVGIFVITANAARSGLVYLFNIMAIISTSLAVFNILPIPALDGGHIIFLAIEKLRKRPLDPKVQEITSQIGLGLLLLLMAFVSYFDVMRQFKK